MKYNKKGSILFIIMIISFVMGSFLTLSFSNYTRAQSNLYNILNERQSSSYSAEGIDLFDGYIRSILKTNNIDGWDEKIKDLNGNYILSFNEGNYFIEEGEYDEFIMDNVTYIRKILIENGENSNSKIITSSVGYKGLNKKEITYQAVFTNNK